MPPFSSAESHPSHAGVVAAGLRLVNRIAVTPLLPWPDRPHVWIKAESLQTGGAFKLRGAFNRLLRIPPEDRPRGVVAFSSGNHAQGIARAAQALGMPAAIVMPADAPAVKLAGTRALGAEVVLYDRATGSREAISAALAEARGAVLVPSFDDVDVIEGQGTAGLEAIAQAAVAGALPIARIVTPCGGGGLAAGLALAVPGAEIVVVEPEGWDDMGASLRAGHIVPVGPGAPRTACDALQTTRVAERTFAVLQARGACGLSVSEAEVEEAMRAAFALGLVVEPGGAVALAAMLAGHLPPIDGTTVVVASGSNVDPAAFARVIAG